MKPGPTPKPTAFKRAIGITDRRRLNANEARTTPCLPECPDQLSDGAKAIWARLGEQLVLFGRGAAWDEDVDPQQLRLATFQAIAAGARGFVFPSDQPLAIDTGPRALRTDAIRLINMELKLLEPWIAQPR